MARKRISVDAALLNNRPYIQLRGVDYELRDLTVRERLERLARFQHEQEEAENVSPEDGEEAQSRALDRVQQVVADAVQEALVDVPDDVAQSITEMEYSAIMVAIAAARDIVFSVTVDDTPEEELKTVGRES